MSEKLQLLTLNKRINRICLRFLRKYDLNLFKEPNPSFLLWYIFKY